MPGNVDGDGRSMSSLHQLFEALPAAAHVCDPDGLITYCNARAVELWGRRPRLRDPAERYSGSHRLFRPDGTPMPHGECWMARALRERREFHGCEAIVEQPGGARRRVSAVISPIRDGAGAFLGASCIQADLGARGPEARPDPQATHDPLTGLPDRACFLADLGRLAAEAREAARPLAMLVLDLYGLRAVNDVYGHEYGDEVLRQLGVRLRGAVGAGDVVARLGSDDFAAVLPGAGRSHALRQARALLEAISRPLRVCGHAMDVGANVGIALQPDHGADASALLRRADVAMCAARRDRAGVRVFAAEHEAMTPDHIEMAAELRRALETGSLVLHYQPKLDLATRDVVGVEALVRWPHPARGLVHPGAFLPLVEAQGHARRLDLWVLREALRQGLAWRHAGLRLGVAVNLTAESLADDAFAAAAMDLLDTAGPAAADLTVELSERTALCEPGRVRTTLDRFRDRGARVALDDFGTGYSALAHLKQLRVDEVKLDCSFVRMLPRSGTDVGIVEAVVALGTRLGMTITAEGVERRETLDWLTTRGCSHAQGFYFAPALPPADLVEWLGRRPLDAPLADALQRA
jgi:diguanylate cyclase (GGDEF)-like protein